jgi:hypothetical protein
MTGIDGLVADGYLNRYEDWETTHQLAAAPEVLREADRCAGIVARQFRLFDSGLGG